MAEHEFTGNPAPLTDDDFARAAARLGCAVAAIRAVADVESAANGFLPDGRPKILFERHIFHRLTEGRFSNGHPHLSARTPGGYRGGAREYERLGEALVLDRAAALKSASWGRFQIMGFNHALCGEPDLEAFVAGMVAAEAQQLGYFAGFIEGAGLAGALRRRDWPAFARGYNGPAHAANDYAGKMARAYARHAAAEERTAPPTLSPGSRGEEVRRLQRLLGVTADGIFGPLTHAALRRVQRARGLGIDGIAGPETWAALRD